MSGDRKQRKVHGADGGNNPESSAITNSGSYHVSYGNRTTGSFVPFVNPMQVFHQQYYAHQIQQQQQQHQQQHQEHQRRQHELFYRQHTATDVAYQMRARAAQSHRSLPVSGPGQSLALQKAQAHPQNDPSQNAAPKAVPALTATIPKAMVNKIHLSKLKVSKEVPKPTVSKKQLICRKKLVLKQKLISKVSEVIPVKIDRHITRQTNSTTSTIPQGVVPTKPRTGVPPSVVEKSHIILASNLHGQVWRAVRLVGEEIKSGVWPLADKEDTTLSLPVVLEQFIREIFFPLLQEKQALEDRPYVATMLALREVMTQNAEKIFDLNLDQYPLVDRMEFKYHGKTLATSIILAANERLPIGNQDLLRFVEAYDTGAQEFKISLPRMSAKQVLIQPGGTELDGEEALIWKVAYNMVREKHPLLRITKVDEKDWPQLAEPSTCYAAMVEDLSTNNVFMAQDHSASNNAKD